MNRFFKFFLPALLAPLFFASCNTESDEPGTLEYSAFATLDAATPTSSSFTISPIDDETPFTVTATQGLAESSTLKPGQRCYISYLRSDNSDIFASGPVELTGVYLVANGSVNIVSKDSIDTFNVAGYGSANAFRSGKYMNVQISAPTLRFNGYSKFAIYADQATVDDAMPQLYVDFEIDSFGMSENMNLGSFDISEIWNRPTCQGINLHIGPRSQEYKKSNVIKPAN